MLQTNSSRAVPDLEKGPVDVDTEGEQTAEGVHPAGRAEEQPTEDDSDNNDKFWNLFLAEAASEAKWKVSLWQAELDSLLVFAGLFAGIVTAFLVDLRSHLRPDPQIAALTEIVSILRNETTFTPNADLDGPTLAELAVGFLYYGSLVATLIGALWGVLAKGWLGETLREPPNNPVDRALERWRRDKAAKQWYMEHVITGVPLLTQIGLAMFLSGFVVQSFDDNRAIGSEVLVYVTLAFIAYGVFTFTPWFHPDCPYRTPLTKFLQLIPMITPRKSPHDVNTKSKIQILVSKLSRSSNDEIFCSAAVMLDGKLESHDSMKWYKGVEKHANEIAEALSVRLKSFAHRVQTITEDPSLSKVLNDSVTSGANGENFLGTLYSPIEQGVACLRVLLRSIEASMTSGSDKSPWVKQEIDRQWRTSKIFPETWRLLSMSIHITRLVAKKLDYQDNNIGEVDWENLVRKTFSDPTLRSISGASTCRGLLHGEPRLKRVCALGLATFVEIEATIPADPSKQIFFEKDSESDTAIKAGEIISKTLWTELTAMWKNTVIQMLHEVHEWDEPETSFMKFLDHDLYRDNIDSIFGVILGQADSEKPALRKQAIKLLSKFSENSALCEIVDMEQGVSKIVSKLDDDDASVREAAIRTLPTLNEQFSEILGKIMGATKGISKLVASLIYDDSDVREATVTAIQAFKTDESYQADINLSIPTIIEQLGNEEWRIKEQNIILLTSLSEFDVFQETIDSHEGILKIINKLVDDDSSVQGAAFAAVSVFCAYNTYHKSINTMIPVIIRQVDDESWVTRQQSIQILCKLSEFDAFKETINNEGTVPKIALKLIDIDTDVQNAAVAGLSLFFKDESYHASVETSISAIISQLVDDSWRKRERSVQLLASLVDLDGFGQKLRELEAPAKFVERLGDDDSDVRGAAFNGMQACVAHEIYRDEFIHLIPMIIKLLDDSLWGSRHQAVHALGMLSEHAVFHQILNENEIVLKIIPKLKDDDYDVRAAAIKALTDIAMQTYFEDVMNSENVISKLFQGLSDDSDTVRSAALQAMFKLSTYEIYGNEIRTLIVIPDTIKQLSDANWDKRKGSIQILLEFVSNDTFREAIEAQEFYQNDFKSMIPALMEQLQNESWYIRQQTIHILSKLSEISMFQETLKNEGFVNKLAIKLEDSDSDVRATAAQALSSLGTNSQFQDRMKSEKAVLKLIAKLTDSYGDVVPSVYTALLELGKQSNVPEFVQTVVSALSMNIIDKEVRQEVYKLLVDLKGSKASSSDDELASFLEEIDGAIFKLLVQMPDKDLSFIRRSLAILAEMSNEALTGQDLRAPSASNKAARDAVENTVRSKLLYEKFSQSERNDAVLALSRLAQNEVFLGCMKPAIPGLTEAVSSNDWNVWSIAVQTIVALSRQSEFRVDLVPAVQKLVQRLDRWDDEDEQYPLNLVEAMSVIVEYKEFQTKLRRVGSILMKQLHKDILNDTMNQNNESSRVAFYQGACKLVSRLCETQSVGRDLVEHLVPVLSNMHTSLTNDLLDLVSNLISSASLTLNDLIALASSLRIASSPAPEALEIQICKLKIAAQLDVLHKDGASSAEYATFVYSVLGSSNGNATLKLSTIVPSDTKESD